MKPCSKTARKKVVSKTAKEHPVKKRKASTKKETTGSPESEKREASQAAYPYGQYPLTQLLNRMPKTSPGQNASYSREKLEATILAKSLELLGPVSGQNRRNMAEESGDQNQSVTQHVKDVARILTRILDDPSYTPDESVLIAYPENILKVLSSVPFELRKTAYRLYLKGIRYFGKVPWPMNHSMESSCMNDLKKLFRHVQCPEGPGEGYGFALAWLEGFDCQIQPPYENDDEATRMEVMWPWVDKQSGLEFHRDHDEEVQNIPSITDLIMQLSKLPSRNEAGKAYFKAIADKIRSFEELNPELKRIAIDAFACGILYCTKVRYPDCQLQHDEDWLSKESVWQWIIVHGLQRHGHTLDRKDLLKALGCINFESYSKSSELARFNPEHSNFTPPISFSSYNKAFTIAKDWLKSNDGTHTPARGMTIGSHLKKREALVKKSEGQRKSSMTKKQALEILDKERKAEKTETLKLARLATQEQEAAAEAKHAAEKAKLKETRLKAAREIR